MSIIMNIEDRREILTRILPLAQQYDELAQEKMLRVESDTWHPEPMAMVKQMEDMKKIIEDLLLRYMNGLPVRELSRCPFSGEVLSMAIDDFGLDGLWWNHHAPKRPENKLPPTYFAMDGALKLAAEPEHVPFLCTPGPDVPFVLPRLLAYTQVQAVISSIKIGRHIAYPVIYYADPMLYGERRVNDWGTARYWEEGSLLPEILTPGTYVSLTPDPEEYDFDLEPWLRKGKLFWIAPDDVKFSLHSHVARCPYLNLPGSRRLKYIQNGEVWEHDLKIEMMEEDIHLLTGSILGS
ncbi:MAG TPA: hypothetical protein DCQ14_07015 [Firmicutes bacterium]|nr:hypothetical protein [Bacillota bacterium]